MTTISWCCACAIASANLAPSTIERKTSSQPNAARAQGHSTSTLAFYFYNALSLPHHLLETWTVFFFFDREVPTEESMKREEKRYKYIQEFRKGKQRAWTAFVIFWTRNFIALSSSPFLHPHSAVHFCLPSPDEKQFPVKCFFYKHPSFITAQKLLFWCPTGILYLKR